MKKLLPKILTSVFFLLVGLNFSFAVSHNKGKAKQSFNWPSGNESAKGDLANESTKGCGTVSITPVNSFICAGSSASLTVSFTKASTYNYTWTTGGITPGSGTLTGATSAVINLFPVVSPTVNTTYTITVTNSPGCTSSASAVVKVDPVVNVTLTATPTVYCSGSYVVSATVSGGTGTYSYNWSITPAPVAYSPGGTTASAITVSPGTPYADNTVSVTVASTAAGGCSKSVPITIKYENLTTNITPSFAVCTGGTGQLCATPSNGGVGPGNYVYKWASVGATGITSAKTGSCVTGAPAGAGDTYSVTVTESADNRCMATASTQINVNPTPTPTLTASPTYMCLGTQTTLSTGLSTGTYVYTWTGNNAPGSFSGKITPSATGVITYNVTVSDGGAGCKASSTVSITVNDNPTVVAYLAANPKAICLGNTFNMGGAPTATGGNTFSPTPTYVYSWTVSDAAGGTPAGTGGTIKPTSASGSPYTYNVTVTDDNSCSATDKVTLTVNDTPVIDAGKNDTICHGSTYTLGGAPTVTGGSGVQTITWSPTKNSLSGASSPNPTITGNNTNGLAGDVTVYTISVTNAIGCNNSAKVSIDVLPPMDTLTKRRPAACTAANGFLKIEAYGGVDDITNGYTFNVAPPGTVFVSDLQADSSTAIKAGNYTVTITTTNLQHCSKVVAVSVPSAGAPTVTITNKKDLLCMGDNSGEFTINVPGGTSTYDYRWSGPVNGSVLGTTSTTATATGLAKGDYTVTVLDINGCIVNATVKIDEPPLFTVSVTTTPVTCGGAGDGTATAVNSGGTTPYGNYTWAGSGVTGNKLISLVANTYNVTASDANGCIATASGTVPDAVPIVITPSSSSPTCSYKTDGTASMAVTGASGTYTYNWSLNTGGQTTASVTGLSGPDTYSVTISDALNVTCLASSSVTLTLPSHIDVLDGAKVGGACGANGSTCVTASGGTGGLNFTWPSGGIPSGSCYTGGAGGTYDVTVTDANSCKTVFASNIPLIGGPKIQSLSFSCATAAGNDGQATLMMDPPGNPTYEFIWSSGGNTFYTDGPKNGLNTAYTTLSGNANYKIHIIDGSGCAKDTTFFICAPTPLKWKFVNSQDLNCAGVGSAVVQAQGGNGSYTYAWSGAAPIGGTTFGPTTGSSTIAPTTAGTYTVTVSSLGGSLPIDTFVYIAPSAPIVVTPFSTDIKCYGLQTGSLDSVHVSGGKPFPGNKYFVNTDVGGIQANTSPTTPIGNIPAGTYGITVTDASNCTAASSFTIQSPGEFYLTHSYVTNAGVYPHGSNRLNCLGDSNGFAWISVLKDASKPGTPASFQPYGYPSYTVTGINPNVLISSPTTQYPVSNLKAGIYNLTVTDAAGCQHIDSLRIIAPQRMTTPATITNPLCFNGTASAQICVTSGGTAPYLFAWPAAATVAAGPCTNGSQGSNLPVAYPSSVYIVTVTDHGNDPVANRCSQYVTLNITEPSQVTIPAATVVTSQPTCFFGEGVDDNGTITLAASGGTGTYTYDWSPAPAPATTNTGFVNGLTFGTYFVTATDANGCTSAQQTAVVNRPLAISASITNVTPANCHQNNSGGIGTGSATVTSYAGNGKVWTYKWSDPAAQTSTGVTATGKSTAVGLLGGTNYTVTVYDKLGCTVALTANITEPPQFSANEIPGTHKDVSCNGVCDGAASLTTNQAGTYNYNWSSGDNVSAVTGLCGTLAGTTYTITVTDAAAGATCSASLAVTITEPPQLLMTTSFTAPLCNGSANGTATATVTPNTGTPTYAYTWFDNTTGSGASDTHTGLSFAGSPYAVTVMDANGCQQVASITMTEPSPITVTVASVKPSPICYNTTTTFGVTVTGGPTNGANYSTVWDVTKNNNFNPTDNTYSSNPFTTGPTPPLNQSNTIDFEVTVTEAPNGCTGVGTASIEVGEPLSVTLTPSPQSIICDSTNTKPITLTSAATPFKSDYLYIWTSTPANHGYSGTLPTATGLSEITVIPTKSVTYMVSVTDGCTGNTSFCTIDAMPVPRATVTGAKDGCDPLDINLLADTNGGNFGNGSRFQWAITGKNVDKGTSIGFTKRYHYEDGNASGDVANFTGTFMGYAQYTGLECPMGKAIPFSFNVYQKPDYSIQLDNNELLTDLNPEAIFKVFKKDPIGDNTDMYLCDYTWHFGDTSKLAKNNILTVHNNIYASHRYSDFTGSYLIDVYITNSHGCKDTVSQHPEIIVGETLMWVPDAFTPNGDGPIENEVFKVKALHIRDFNMWIYDRWGNLVFHSTDPEIGWDGKAINNDQIAQQDVYIYKITYTDYRGEKSASLTGKVTLIK